MKRFTILWLGEWISSIGSGMTAFALAIHVHHLTGSASWVGLVTLLAFMPTILLSPIGGLLADRFDRRLLMLLGDLLSVIGLLVVLAGASSGTQGLPLVCIGITLNAIFVALLEPAYRATVTDLVPETDYARANGMVGIATNSRYLLSPALAGLLLAVADLRLILLIDMATFLVTVTTIVLARRGLPATPRTDTHMRVPFRTAMREGAGATLERPDMLRLIGRMTLVCCCVGILQTLMVPMVLGLADARTLGFMESISAIGMVAGSILMGVLNPKHHHARHLRIGLVATGLFMALAGVPTRCVWIVLFCFLFFAALPVVNTSADCLIRGRIPNGLQGRVWGLVSVLTQSGSILAFAFSGLLADKLFNPLLQPDGALANSVGRFVGVGAGRGIGLMLCMTGILLALCGIGSKMDTPAGIVSPTDRSCAKAPHDAPSRPKEAS